MKNFKIMGVHWKIWLLGGGSSQKTDIEGEIARKGGRGLGQFTDLRRGLGKREGNGVFEGV